MGVFESWVIQAIGASGARPIVIGLQAPQGAGKTTRVGRLLEVLAARGWRAAAVSIDDFYLTRAEQVALAAAHPGHPYLEHRGYPGTHDIALGVRTLDALRALGGNVGSVRIPVYDKSAHGGRGDRLPESAWRQVDAPLDVVVVEGWMLGFTPVDHASLDDRDLQEPNSALAAYSEWYARIDRWVVLRADDPSFVIDWRVEAEERMKAAGKPGLSRADIEDYIRRFLPAYRTWADGTAAGRAPDLLLRVNRDRSIEVA